LHWVEGGGVVLFDLFFSAIALMLVFEGVLPFLLPSLWRNMMRSFSMQSDRAVRLLGFVLMLVGVLVLYSLHH
jgi:uncharacterized protein YjeT (DUF2065 family)